MNCLGCNRLELPWHRCNHNCKDAIIDATKVNITKSPTTITKQITYKEWLAKELDNARVGKNLL